MVKKQVWVNVKETKLIEQFLNSTLASVSWKQLMKFMSKDAELWDKVTEEVRTNELYKTVGDKIVAEANRIVDEKCKPEWDRLSEMMRPLGEERNVLAKEKAEANKEEKAFPEEKANRIEEIDKILSDLSNEYQKVTDGANAQLREFKEKVINETEWVCFFLTEDEYQTIWEYAWFTLPKED